MSPIVRDNSYNYDLFPISVDNCASYCITNNPDDFVGSPERVSILIWGTAGHMQARLLRGTVQWKIKDDNRWVHSIPIKWALYVLEAPGQLLSPQHWGQLANNHVPTLRGTICKTHHDSVVLLWNQH